MPCKSRRMNYRHIYHAGNFADVVKHALLTLVIAHLRRKEQAFHIIDTHAGIGCYDLQSVEASKTGEALGGIIKLLDGGALPSVFENYMAAVQAVNPDWPMIHYYPGSPFIARNMLRPQDRLTLVELHPQDAEILKRAFRRDPQVAVHVLDAYTALKAQLPPKERRGLVLIDPPFEVKDEFRRIVKGIGEAMRRWPTGIYGIWYPIKDRDPVERFLAELSGFGKPYFSAELMMFADCDPNRLNGAGLAIINPPWKLDEALEGLLPLLKDRLGAAGEASLRWLQREN